MSARVARVRAPNPSPMTLDGTNSYVVHAGGSAVVIDPGPAIEAHVDALVDAVGDDRLAAIFVTHGHPDHFPAAAPLAARTGAPVVAHAATRFPHDRALGDGETFALDGMRFVAIDAPGHTFDHLVFRLEDEGALFTGDVVIGRGTVVIAPPGGAMRPYQATLRRLREEHGDVRRIYGGHGPEIDDPRAKLDEYIAHRAMREAEIFAQLERRASTIPELVAAIYLGVDRRLWPAAARQVLAYLEALESEGRVRGERLERAPSAEESGILDPDLRAIADPEVAALARAELGYARTPPLDRYTLV